ncbi:sigma-70 family RNA polymerase sigma factor [Actinokineospora pegani]|uniref:sigma-70 family RNA polymerase sigma factor n=1 Tax=Actinokineospora pegani TaxID=2654637 RepID=UPI0012EA2F0C|nr:sigma-70 family RNA polymerase sigma factor [Actinokineospora pegani]
MTDARRAVEAVWRLESAAVVGALTRVVRDVGLAEELAQDALVAALAQWPRAGVPDNPAAWLVTTAKRRAVDHLRRSQRFERAKEHLVRPDQVAGSDQDERDGPEQDDALRLVLLTCHPVLPTEQRVALTLRLAAGLSTAEIARAFLTTEQRVAQRVAAAKEALAGVPVEVPRDASDRVAAALEVVYLTFNEGYSATAGDDLVRLDLVREALRLGRLLAALAPREPEAHGLVALMEVQASRSAARTDATGAPVALHEQNRGRWDRLLIRRGFAALLRARDLGRPPGPYVLQAAIAVCHAQAATAEDTDWARIAGLYDALARLLPTPVVRLNQAVAVGMARGPAAGLDLVDRLRAEPSLRDYHPLPVVRADLLARLDRPAEARVEFERAAALTDNAAEREFLLRRAADLPAQDRPTLGASAEAFLARTDLDPTTLRSYGQTLGRVRRALGDAHAVDAITAGDLARVFDLAWSGAAAKTWNRHRSAVRTFCAWARLPDLAADIDRRPETRHRVPPLPPEQVALLWTLDVPVRELALWRMLHESGAPVRTVLALDVEQLDLDDRRARVGAGWVSWRAATARLLAELLAGRETGPVFRSRRGAGRLSYERAESLFKQATKALDPAGLTLGLLRR